MEQPDVGGVGVGVEPVVTPSTFSERVSGLVLRHLGLTLVAMAATYRLSNHMFVPMPAIVLTGMGLLVAPLIGRRALAGVWRPVGLVVVATLHAFLLWPSVWLGRFTNSLVLAVGVAAFVLLLLVGGADDLAQSWFGTPGFKKAQGLVRAAWLPVRLLFVGQFLILVRLPERLTGIRTVWLRQGAEVLLLATLTVYAVGLLVCNLVQVAAAVPDDDAAKAAFDLTDGIIVFLMVLPWFLVQFVSGLRDLAWLLR
ncbi:MAG: hypothetical protein ACKO3S_11160 [bacterium]